MSITDTNNKTKETVLNELRSSGYSVIQGYLSRSECERFVKHIDWCIAKYPHKVQRDFKEGLGGDYRLFGLENTDKVIYDTLFSNEYFDILKTYTKNTETTPCTVMAGLIRKEGIVKINSGGSWHRDPGTQYGTKVKTIIYLTDVDTTKGPFTIIPSSLSSDVGVGHFREDCPKIHQGLRICDDFIDELGRIGKLPVEVLAPAGTLILVDVGNIHRGKPIEVGERYSLTNYFGSNQKGSDSFKRNQTHFL